VATINPRTSSKVSNKEASSWIQRLSWHGFHLALLAFSVYVLIVLITFDASDPTSTQAFDVSNIHNAGGTFGAVLADLFFWALGLIAYLIPLLLIQYEVIRFIGQSRYTHYDPDNNVWFKMLTLSALVIAACVYASIHISNTDLTYPQGSGGLLGLTLGLPLNKALGMTGTNILLLTTLILAISHFWQLRWGTITETIGRHSIYWCEHLWQSLFGQKRHTQELKTPREAVASPSSYGNPAPKLSLGSKLAMPITAIWRFIRNLWPFKRVSNKPKKPPLKTVIPVHKKPIIPVTDDQSLTSRAADFSVDDVAAALDSVPTKSKASVTSQTPTQSSTPATSATSTCC
jgi:DNA segregation ATPase FtsK/SpoIIIE-like protein